MKNVKITICLMAAVLFMAAEQSFGAVEFNDGGTHDISSTIDDDVLIDYQSPGMQTTLNLLNGGKLGIYADPYHSHSHTLQGYGDSRINIYAGSILGNLSAYDNSRVTLNGGMLTDGSSEPQPGCIAAYDNSQVTISDSFQGYLYGLNAYGHSKITMSGGSGNYYSCANDNSQIIISGGDMRGLSAMDNSQITVSSGHVSDLYGSDSSRVTMSGGSAGIWTFAASSRMTMSGGHVTLLQAGGSSQMTMTGGTTYGFVAEGDGYATWSGGAITGYLASANNAILAIVGSNFAIDGKPVGFGEITSMSGSPNSDDSMKILTGTLANGDIINTRFAVYEDASIVLTPEPATLLLLGLGAVLLRKHRG